MLLIFKPPNPNLLIHLVYLCSFDSMLYIYIKKYIPSFFPPPPKTLNNCNLVMVHYSHSGNNESGVEKVVSWEGDNLAQPRSGLADLRHHLLHVITLAVTFRYLHLFI